MEPNKEKDKYQSMEQSIVVSNVVVIVVVDMVIVMPLCSRDKTNNVLSRRDCNATGGKERNT